MEIITTFVTKTGSPIIRRIFSPNELSNAVLDLLYAGRVNLDKLITGAGEDWIAKIKAAA